MIKRCCNEKYKSKHPAYKNTSCSNEWMDFNVFYKWLSSQDNYKKWKIGKYWAIDKDIIFKGNNFYSSETCCLVPQRVNNIFTKRNSKRGILPIGVTFERNKYRAYSSGIHLGDYNTPEEAFMRYKEFKENYIKQVAKEEYEIGNIVRKCYDAMINYQVEITD